MNSLERMNYVVRHDDGNYALGPRLLYLGKLYEQSFHLSRVVQPELQALSMASQESASWYVLEGGAASLSVSCRSLSRAAPQQSAGQPVPAG